MDEQDEHWLDVPVEIGRFDDRQPDRLRVFRYAADRSRVVLQARRKGWYTVATLRRDNMVELINALVTQLAELDPPSDDESASAPADALGS
jgi:hypothetical protein